MKVFVYKSYSNDGKVINDNNRVTVKTLSLKCGITGKDILKPLVVKLDMLKKHRTRQGVLMLTSEEYIKFAKYLRRLQTLEHQSATLKKELHSEKLNMATCMLSIADALKAEADNCATFRARLDWWAKLDIECVTYVAKEPYTSNKRFYETYTFSDGSGLNTIKGCLRKDDANCEIIRVMTIAEDNQ